MAILTHAGVNLHYDRTGSGPAVLLIHGWMCNRTFWTRQVQALRDRFTVITVDLRGHGESSPPRTGYSVGSMAADLEQLIRALGLPRLALVGWSLGGMVAQDLARRLGDRVSALALVGSTAGGLTDPANPNSEAAREADMRAALTADFRAFARGFTVTFFKDGDRSPLYAWAASQTQKTPPHAAEACFETIVTADLRPHLSALRVPTAVLHGRHDVCLPLGHGEALAKNIPGARLVVFEESGHAPFLEEPDAFNAALTAFLTGERPAATPPTPAPARATAAPKPAAAKATPPKKRAPRAAPKPAAKPAKRK